MGDRQMPEPAWGEPTRRRNEWMAFAAGWLASASAAYLLGSAAVAGVFGVIGFASVAAVVHVHKEVGVANGRMSEARARAAETADRDDS
jgi:nitrate reductase NapE component